MLSNEVAKLSNLVFNHLLAVMAKSTDSSILLDCFFSSSELSITNHSAQISDVRYLLSLFYSPDSANLFFQEIRIYLNETDSSVLLDLALMNLLNSLLYLINP
jgi:hypothetical protein